MSPRRLSLITGVTVIVLAGGVLVACSGDDKPPGPAPSATSSASASPAVDYQRYLSDPPVPAIGGANGSLPGATGGSVPVRLDVVAVEAGADSTLLRWRLSSTQEGAALASSSLSREIRSPDTSALTLIAKQADLSLQPAAWRSRNLAVASQCSCSTIPQTLGARPTDLSALFPPLPDDVTTVDVSAPGFAAISVPVTRR
jgi:hypothetical protein